MEFLKKILGYIEEKMFLTTIIATLIISVIVFKAFWVHLITIIWVSPIMSKLYGHELLLAIVYGAIIALYYYRKFKFTQYYNNNRVYYFVLLFLIYILCFRSKEWNFSLITDKTYFSAWTNLIFLPIIPEIGLYLNCRKRKDITYYPQLEIEKTTETDDAYQRNGCCESVYKVVNTCFFEEQSFAVGISGSWGSGKTTYINALKRRFNESEEDISVIDFEPWKNDNSSLIIKSFFSLLKSELKPHISNISIPIDKYVSSLLDCDVPIKWEFFLNTIHFLSVANKKSPYEQIKDYLKASKHRVVVFIDDIDRLDKDEIKEVLKLIRNTANFPYIQFIVAYDKDYIISTLKDSGIESPTNYLEKFFNLEITLPKYENRIICSELEKRLPKGITNFWPELDDSRIKQMIYYYPSVDDGTESYRYLIPRVLTSIRDVIRFYNSLYISIHTVDEMDNINEIEFEDLFYLELLRYRYNDIYMILRNRPLSLLIISEDPNMFTYSENKYLALVQSYKPHDQVIIKDLLYFLFKNGINGMHSLCKRRDYSKYFMLRLDEYIFTANEFFSLMDLNEKELLKRAEKMYNEKDKLEFKNQIYEIMDFISTSYANRTSNNKKQPHYKAFFKTLKSLLKSQLLNDEITRAIIPHIQDIISYDQEYLNNILGLFNYLNLSHYREEFNVVNFLSSILIKSNLNANSDYFYPLDYRNIFCHFLVTCKDVVYMSNAITEFVETIINRQITADQLVINVPTLSKIKLDYFINCKEKLSEVGLILFSNCIYYNNKSNQRHIMKGALEIMRTEIKEKPESYLLNFIHKYPSIHNTATLYPEHFYLDIFGCNENFEYFLEYHKSLPSYARINKFWNLYMNNNYKPLKIDNINLIEEFISSRSSKRITVVKNR